MLFLDKTFSFINESYLFLAMCGLLNLHYFNWDTFGNIINSSIALSFVCITVTFPLTVGLLYQNDVVERLIRKRDNFFMKKFGSLAQGLAIFREGKNVFTFIWVSQLRKLWFALTLVFL